MTDHDQMLARAQYFVDCKYVARADERQKSMGLAYVEAERQDLAREMVNFAMSYVAPLRAVAATPTTDRLREAELALAVWDNGNESEYWLRYPDAMEYIGAGGCAADPDRAALAAQEDGS